MTETGERSPSGSADPLDREPTGGDRPSAADRLRREAWRTVEEEFATADRRLSAQGGLSPAQRATVAALAVRVAVGVVGPATTALDAAEPEFRADSDAGAEPGSGSTPESDAGPASSPATGSGTDVSAAAVGRLFGVE